jgi:hypothetical protein
MPAGHNARLCRLFARDFERRGYGVRYLIPVHGAAAFPGEEAAVERALPYPYWRRYGHLRAPDHPLDARLNAIVERAQPGTGFGWLERPSADRRLTRLLARGLAPVLDGLAPGPDDLVMLPTAELYGSGALLAWLERRPPASSPAVLLRFLNILETEPLFRPYTALKALLRKAVRLQRRGHRVHLAAEVAPWAERLQRRIEDALPVHLMPAPPQAAAAPARPRRPERLGLSLISLRRGEQGVGRVATILEGIPSALRRHLDAVMQAPDGTFAVSGARAALVARAGELGLRLIDDKLDDAALAIALAELDVTLLPYLPERYRTRGSSMFFEAADQGHSVLASEGCGFSPEVEAFGLGRLCRSDAEFSQALTVLLQSVAEGRHPRPASEAAAARYNAQRRRQLDLALDAMEVRKD